MSLLPHGRIDGARASAIVPGMTSLHSPLSLARGPAWKNRFMLAPLTNLQSHADGVLSDDEFRWLVKRAEGGFGLTMTCAAHVQAKGQGFPGQLGIFADKHLPGLTRLAKALNAEGTHSVVQLHHAGMRTPRELIGGATKEAVAARRSGRSRRGRRRELFDDARQRERRERRESRGPPAWAHPGYPLRRHLRLLLRRRRAGSRSSGQVRSHIRRRQWPCSVR